MSTGVESASARVLVEPNKPHAWWAAPLVVVGNLVSNRFLLSSFIRRDLRIRYRDSVLGYLWSLVEPLLLTGVYYVLYTVIAHKPQKRYAMWVVIGILVWGFFNRCLTGAMNALSGNSGLIKQIYFPREIFAFANAGSQLVIAFASFAALLPFMMYFGAVPGATVVYIPLGMILVGMLGLGIGLASSIVACLQRDVTHFFNFILRAGFFLSPVIWTLQQLDGKHAGVIDKLLYNPVVVPIALVRAGFEGKALPSLVSTEQIVYSVAVCIAVFVLGLMFFKRFESEVVKNI